MLQWALKTFRDIRTSQLYLLCHCLTVQLLVFQRCVRFFYRLRVGDPDSRFVGGVAATIAEAGLQSDTLGPNMFTFWPAVVEDHLVPVIIERLLYQWFVELLATNLADSSRVGAMGTAPLLKAFLAHCFDPEDRKIQDPSVLEVAHDLCRSDCSIYVKHEYVEGERVDHFFVHHLPSWLRRGQHTVVRGFL